jgi:hypothetical protein
VQTFIRAAGTSIKITEKKRYFNSLASRDPDGLQVQRKGGWPLYDRRERARKSAWWKDKQALFYFAIMADKTCLNSAL